MLKKNYFSGGHQLFQISPRTKSTYDRGKKYLFIDQGGIAWDRGGNFKFIDRGSHRGALHRGTWTGCFWCI